MLVSVPSSTLPALPWPTCSTLLEWCASSRSGTSPFGSVSFMTFRETEEVMAAAAATFIVMSRDVLTRTLIHRCLHRPVDATPLASTGGYCSESNNPETAGGRGK